MKRILFVLTLIICLLSFTSCKRNRIDHEDSTYIYVWKYDIHGDSCLYKYHQPIYHHTVIVDKKMHSSYHGVPGKGGHRHTSYYVYYKIGSETIREQSSHLYFNTEKGTKVVVLEQFYPFYSIKVVEICK